VHFGHVIPIAEHMLPLRHACSLSCGVSLPSSCLLASQHRIHPSHADAPVHPRLQLDHELLLNAQQQQQHQQPMASPFARAPLGAGFDAGGRHGTPPLDSLGHAISLPNPDALRQAGVSPGLQPQHGGHSGAMGGGDRALGGGAHNARVNALRMNRHASLEGALPAHLAGFGNGSLSSLGPRSGSGSLGMLPPGPNPSGFARAGSQPPGGHHYPSPSRPLGHGDNNVSRFGSLSGPHPFAHQHGPRRSFDLGGISSAVRWTCAVG